MVMAVVLACIVSLISQAYRVHDTVTGTMILEEVLVKMQNVPAEEIDNERRMLDAYGEKLGNPRLWLGAYKLEIKSDETKVSGTARAGDWNSQIEMELFQPGRFLRRCEAIRELGEDWADDGS